MMDTEPNDWDIHQVKLWVSSIGEGFSGYAEEFFNSGIDGRELLGAQLGIRLKEFEMALGHREELLSHIEKLQVVSDVRATGVNAVKKLRSLEAILIPLIKTHSGGDLALVTANISQDGIVTIPVENSDIVGTSTMCLSTASINVSSTVLTSLQQIIHVLDGSEGQLLTSKQREYAGARDSAAYRTTRSTALKRGNQLVTTAENLAAEDAIDSIQLLDEVCKAASKVAESLEELLGIGGCSINDNDDDIDDEEESISNLGDELSSSSSSSSFDDNPTKKCEESPLPSVKTNHEKGGGNNDDVSSGDEDTIEIDADLLKQDVIARAVVLYDFVAEADDELNITAGERLNIVKVVDSEWIYCIDPKTNNCGLVAVNFVSLLTSENGEDVSAGEGCAKAGTSTGLIIDSNETQLETDVTYSVELSRHPETGLGCTIKKNGNRSGGVLINRVFEGGTAHINGLHPGDEIIRINDTSIRGMSPPMVATLLHSTGDVVVFHYLKTGQATEVSVDPRLSCINEQRNVKLGAEDSPTTSINSIPRGKKSELIPPKNVQGFEAYPTSSLTPQETLCPESTTKSQKKSAGRPKSAKRQRQAPSDASPRVSNNQGYRTVIIGGVPVRTAITDALPQRQVEIEKRKNVQQQQSAHIQNSPTVSSSSSAVAKSTRDFGRAVNTPAHSIKNVTMKGWLQKLGGSGLTPKNWRRRYFVLSQGLLYYYKQPIDAVAIGAITLPSFQIQPVTDAYNDKKWVFRAFHPHVRTYIFAAENKDSMTEWMNAMSLASIQYEQKEGAIRLNAMTFTTEEQITIDRMIREHGESARREAAMNSDEEETSAPSDSITDADKVDASQQELDSNSIDDEDERLNVSLISKTGSVMSTNSVSASRDSINDDDEQLNVRLVSQTGSVLSTSNSISAATSGNMYRKAARERDLQAYRRECLRKLKDLETEVSRLDIFFDKEVTSQRLAVFLRGSHHQSGTSLDLLKNNPKQNISHKKAVSDAQAYSPSAASKVARRTPPVEKLSDDESTADELESEASADVRADILTKLNELNQN